MILYVLEILWSLYHLESGNTKLGDGLALWRDSICENMGDSSAF